MLRGQLIQRFGYLGDVLTVVNAMTVECVQEGECMLNDNAKQRVLQLHWSMPSILI
jgi:hypothetical protein